MEFVKNVGGFFDVVACSRCNVRSLPMEQGEFESLREGFAAAGWLFEGGDIIALCPRCAFDHYASLCLDSGCECKPRIEYFGVPPAYLPRRMPDEDWMWPDSKSPDEFEVPEEVVASTSPPAEPSADDSVAGVAERRPRRRRAKRRRRQLGVACSSR